MVPITIKGSEMPVAKIFSDDFVFTIPNYQRPYAWTEAEAGELLDDLLIAMENVKSSVDELNPYFLGSIVLIKGDQPDSEIVDGQQRLVTLTILLSAIRKLVPSEVAENISNFILERKCTIMETPERYRLTIREKDKLFFQEYIQADGGLEKLNALKNALSESCKNIRNNALLFLSRLKTFSEEKRHLLAKFIVKKCFMVIVSTPDHDSAYRIFSVLNDRGLDLSLTDILKAEIIGQIGKHDEEGYTKKWEDLEDNLGRESFEVLFAHIRMIKAKSKLRASVLKEFREHVKPTANPTEFIDKTLLPMGESFDQIKNASFESVTKTDDINKFLKYLNRVDNFDWQPPAILYMTLNKNNPEELLRFLVKLERLATGMMIMRADINYRIKRYGRVLEAIENNSDLFGEESPLQFSEEERKKIIDVLDGDIYEIKKIRLPILLRLDEALSEGEANYNYPIISIEHVLPKSPPAGSKWLEWWPDEQIRLKYLNRLGNLVLLSRRTNSQASNFEFEQKKEQYFKRNGVCSFALTSMVLTAEEWTPAVVEQRQQALIAKLKEVWEL